MSPRRLASMLLLFGILVVASRLPFAPRRLFSYDDVNLAYAMEDFNPPIGHPQPPSYPLFVLQMRLLDWLGLDRPETILLALALAASTVGLIVMVSVGELMFAPGVGFCAAWLLLFHHSFWYAGLTSSLRTQLAVISLVVGGTCYGSWTGGQRWLFVSSAALGVGAGIRPELGVLLFPIWIAGLLRSRVGWPRIGWAIALLVAIVLGWLVPTMIASGGPLAWLSMCWLYLKDQSVLTSVMFGASSGEWWSTLVRLLVWTASSAAFWPLAAILAWRTEDGLGFGWSRVAFLMLWFLPSFLFSALVHIQDPGHALGMVPVVCLVGGHMLHRAAGRLAPWFGGEHALVALLLPILVLNGLVFLGRFPIPEDRPATGQEAFWREVHHAVDLSSMWQTRRSARIDDRALDQVERLTADWRGAAVVIWDGGHMSYVKASYYFPTIPVYAVTPKSMHPGSPLVTTKLLGSGPGELIEGAVPVQIQVPAAARVIWMINPEQPLLSKLRERFPLQEAGPVYFHDLPREEGEADLGRYLLGWRSER